MMQTTRLPNKSFRQASLSLSKIFLITILLLFAGLINFSFYNTTVASADTQTTTTTSSGVTKIIAGNSSEFVQHEGLASTIQPREDGMRVDPMPGTYEWWYLQGTFEDGSQGQFTFFSKPWFDNSGPLYPYVAITITAPDGKVYHDIARATTDQYSAARNQANVTIGKNWMRGDLETYQLHIQSSTGLGADLVFNRDAPSARVGGGSGIFYLDPSLTRYLGYFAALPSAKVQGSLTYNGQTHQVQGSGYHDHNWGTVSYNQVLDLWYWTGGKFGNYTLDVAMQVASSYYNHQQMPALYLARGNQVLINDMSHLTVKGSGNITAPGGHDYPKILNFHWQNGSATFNLTLTNPKLISGASPVLLSNATIFGNPEYLRLSGSGTLNVNIAGKNDTASGPAVWEVNYAH